MKRRDYEVFYIIEMLSAAKHGSTKKKLRDATTCNGVKFSKIFNDIFDRGLIESAPPCTVFTTTETGRMLLEEWYSILSAFGLSDKLANLR